MADSKVSIDIVGRDKASGAFAAASRSLDKLSKKVSGIPLIGKQASQALSGLAASIGPQAIAAGVGAGVTALVAGFTVAIAKTRELGESVLNFQRLTKMSAEDSSRFVAALDDMGISGEAGAAALFKLSQNTSKLNAIGVQSGTNLKETFLNVADAIADTTDAGRQSEVVVTAFGKAGKELLPILQQGRRGIEELFASTPEGQIFNQEQIDAIHEMNLGMDALGDAAQEMALKVGKNAIPEVTKLAFGLADLAEKANEAESSLSGRLARAAAELSRLTPFTAWLDSLRTGGDAAAEAALKEQDLQSRREELLRTTKEATDAEEAHAEAIEATVDATEAVSDAQTSLEDAQRSLSKLLQEGAVDEEDVARSRDRLADATRGVTEAEDRLGDARKRLNDLMDPSATDAEDLAIRRARAQQEIANAERRLNAVREAGGSPTAITEAELALREARLGLSRADEDATERAEEIEDARKDVATAEDAVARSKAESKRAGDELRRAEAGDEEYALKVARAREAVSDSERTLARAHDGVRDALVRENEQLDALAAKRQAIINQAPSYTESLNLGSIPAAALRTTPSAPSQALTGNAALTQIFNLSAPLLSPETMNQILDEAARRARLGRMIGGPQ